MSGTFNFCQRLVNELEIIHGQPTGFKGPWDETKITPSNVIDNVMDGLNLRLAPAARAAPPARAAPLALAAPPAPPAPPAPAGGPGFMPPPGFIPAKVRMPMNGGGVNLNVLINDILQRDLIIHNGKQIVNVPTADELLVRIITPLWYEKIGVDVVGNELNYMGGKQYENVPANMSKTYIDALRLNDAAWKAWDAQVKIIRDGLANIGGAGTTVFAKKNLVTGPTPLSVSTFTRYPASIRSALSVRRNSDPSMDYAAAGVLKKVGSLTVSVQNGGNMRGGNVNAHAPLYPSVVMNGGAFPFATPSTSPVQQNAVQVLTNRIDNLIAQYESLSRNPLNVGLKTNITTYKNNVKLAVDDLNDNLNAINGAIPVLAQYPVGRGIDTNSWDKTKLEEIAERGRKLNEAAARAGRRFDKLSSIRDLLQELVNKSRPYNDQIPPFTGGSLHDALKH